MNLVWQRWIRHLRSLLVFRLQREICLLCLSHSCRIRSLRVFIRVRDLILEVRVPIGYDLKILSDFVTHSSSCWSCCLQLVPILRRPARRITFLERVGLHLVIMCFLLVPIVLRELVETVVCLPENFDSFNGVADASSIIVERLPGFVFVIHVSGIFAESRFLVNSPADSSNPELFVLAPGLTRKVCQTVWFHGDLVQKEQCTSVCKKITPVLLLTLYLVRIHAACLIINLLLVLGEITQCRLGLLFAVSSATTSLKQCVSSRLRADDHRADCAKSSLSSSRASGKPSVFPSSGRL